MDTYKALSAFGSLSQETRLKAFKLLVEHGTSGCAACTLSDKLGVPQNTLSFHLSHLSNAGLVTSKREGRSIIYTANFKAVEGLMGYMAENCCASDTVDCLTSKRLTKKKLC
jgi:DNA-binding transcriptional ArsR family regulator